MAPESASETNYGGFWVRVLAHVIDGILLLLIIIPVNLSVYGVDYLQSTSLVAGPVDLIVSYVLPAIAVIMFWRYREATPGKMLLSLRIVDATTLKHPSTAQFVGRYFAYIVAMLPLGFGFAWAAFDPRKQGWHDKLAGTVVLRGKPAPSS